MASIIVENRIPHTFPTLPEIVGDIEEDCLEGEDDAHPLVPCVPDLVALVGTIIHPAVRGNRYKD